MRWRSLEESPPAPEKPTLKSLYAERRALIARYVPQEAREIHERVIQELKQGSVGRAALQEGIEAPDFELADQQGRTISSSRLLERGRLVVCFFRGRWCPFCVAQMEAMNAVFPAIESSAASLVGISPQTVHQSSLMADQHRLRFPLLSDAGNKVARRFGLVYRVPEYQQEIYQRVFINLPFVNGDPSWELPIPATYILEGDHRIRYAASNPDYMDRPEPGELVRRLVELAQ
jgi:peroxiredoxin